MTFWNKKLLKISLTSMVFRFNGNVVIATVKDKLLLTGAISATEVKLKYNPKSLKFTLIKVFLNCYI